MKIWKILRLWKFHNLIVLWVTRIIYMRIPTRADQVDLQLQQDYQRKKTSTIFLITKGRIALSIKVTTWKIFNQNFNSSLSLAVLGQPRLALEVEDVEATLKIYFLLLGVNQQLKVMMRMKQMKMMVKMQMIHLTANLRDKGGQRASLMLLFKLVKVLSDQLLTW